MRTSEVVVIQTAFLGDVILTTPLLAALAGRHGPVDVVVRPEAVNLLDTHPAVARVIAFDKAGTRRGPRGLWRFAHELRGRRHAIAYLPHRSLRSGLIAALARIPRRVGFADAAARWLYTERRPQAGAREAARLRGLAGTATGDAPPAPHVALTPADHRVADRALAAAGIGEPFVALAPGSARPTKRWPYYRELAERLARRVPVVIVGAVEDAGVGPRGAGAPHPTLDLAGRLTLRQAAALLARAALVVANDSAPMHLAAAVGAPVLAIFGPTAAAMGFAPEGPRHAVIELSGLSCRPCSPHGGARCPLGHHRCLRELPPDDVAAHVLRVLSQETLLPCG